MRAFPKRVQDGRGDLHVELAAAPPAADAAGDRSWLSHSALPAADGAGEWSRRVVTHAHLLAFYRKHDPSKVDTVAKILKA